MSNQKILPDVLCIGSMKSGTTWLYELLRSHPRFRMPPVKEIGFFNAEGARPRVSDILSSSAAGETMACSLKAAGHIFRHAPLRDWRRHLWCLRFVTGKRTERWYQALFKRPREYYSADISPSYAILNEAQISRVYDLMPDIKIIFMMRDPVHRDWAHLKYTAEIFTKPELLKDPLPALRGAMIRDYSRYDLILERWSRCFPKSSLKLIYFEELKKDPVFVAREIFDFIGGSEIALCSEAEKAAQSKVLQGTVRAMPEEAARALAGDYLGMTKRIKNRYGRGSGIWHDACLSLLEDSGRVLPRPF